MTPRKIISNTSLLINKIINTSLLVKIEFFIYYNFMQDYKRARTDQQKEDRRFQIKKAADELFKSMPYTDITLTTIAEKLEWSRANLYKYASTKEEIYLDIEQDRMKEYFSSLLTAFPKNCRFSDETAAEIWTAQVISHEDYFRYLAFLLTIIERNVTVERLTVFKKTFYEMTGLLKKQISFALGIPEDKAENLNLSIIHFASSCFSNCTKNPLIAQALKNLNITLPERDLPLEIKDFILMNIYWIKK